MGKLESLENSDNKFKNVWIYFFDLDKNILLLNILITYQYIFYTFNKISFNLIKITKFRW